MLGQGTTGLAAQRRCMAVKTVVTGGYTACRYRAEARLARTLDTTRYDQQISRCEANFERGWNRIVNRTARRGTTCFDDQLTITDYKEAIDSDTDKISAVLEGVDQLDPVSLAITGSPLTLSINGEAGALTVTNNSDRATAIAIKADFSDTALAGNVTESGNTCSNVAAGASCTLTFTPGNTVVPTTEFSVQGSNTESVNASLSIQSGSTLTAVEPPSGSSSGGTAVELTGIGLTGATSVTFGGVAATSINVVNSTTVTAVTPKHAVGTVDVVIETPAGGATITDGFEYVVPAVGLSAQGGNIACLDGGFLNLVATTEDNSESIEWGGHEVETGAQSKIDGQSNTTLIVNELEAGSYAAQLCNDHEVDSRGNTPCQAGNTCYNDWFLPAEDQLECILENWAEIGIAPGIIYWTSTESHLAPGTIAIILAITVGDAHEIFQHGNLKSITHKVRCVRAFEP